jgi:hypothetical protein
MIRRLLLALISLAFALLLSEGILRVLGKAPAPAEPPLRVVASNGPFYTLDDELGYLNSPDRETRIRRLEVPREFEYTARTDAHRRRRTAPPDSDGEAGRPEIWIFGCSFTFGAGVEDDQTYPWLLQQRLPSYAVRNYGVNGYGTVQSLLQYRRELAASQPPRIALLAYASFHDERNVMSISYHRSLGRWWRSFGSPHLPYLERLDDGSFQLRMSSPYQPFFPFVERSALANRLDRAIVKLLERKALREDHRQDVSRHLVDEFEKESRSQGVVFALGQLDQPQPMLEWARSRGIPAADLSVPKDDPEFTIEGDGHPNARGQRLIADRAEALIRSLMTDSSDRSASRG